MTINDSLEASGLKAYSETELNTSCHTLPVCSLFFKKEKKTSLQKTQWSPVETVCIKCYFIWYLSCLKGASQSTS